MRFLILLSLAISVFASTLHLSIGASPSRINPILATDSASAEIAGWVFSSLVKYDKNGDIVGDLAESFEFLNERELLFRLRKNVYWHDGEPFEAEDVVFTYETIVSPKVFTPYASQFRFVQSVEAIDSHTVLVKYKKPYFKALEIWMTGILPQHILKNEDNLMTSSFNQKPVGTGPYMIKEFEVSKDIVLYANDRYYEHPPKIDKIVYHFIPDPSTNFLMLKSGKLDVGSLSSLQYERQIDDKFKKRFNIYEQISHGYTYLGFNLKREKFKDRRVREALSLAVDRKELVDILFFSHGRVCTGPFMPGSFAFDESVKPPKVDLEKARRLLKEAGYDENNPLVFELATNSNNSIRLYAAQIIQYQLAKIGVKVKIKAMEWQAFLNTVVHPRRFDAVLLGWSLGLTPDAYPLWHSDSAKPGGFNLVGYSNKEVDRLIVEAEATVDRKRLSEIYKKIFRLIVDDLPYLFLYIPNSIVAVNSSIKPVEPSIIGIFHNEIEWIKP